MPEIQNGKTRVGSPVIGETSKGGSLPETIDAAGFDHRVPRAVSMFLSELRARGDSAAECLERRANGSNGAKPADAPVRIPERIPRWKRTLDLTCIAITSPCWAVLMIVLAAWIKIVSRGPVFFRQERIGFRGKRFMILKFRSMHVNVETQSHEGYLEQLIKTNRPMTKLDAAGDPRLILGARILRATGLDELPQLFNVLRGEMSLVGPRPCTPHEFQRYKAWQQERVNTPPGLTGYWQVNGKNKTTFSEMITMDLIYAYRMSARLDLTIMLKTIPAITTQVLEAWQRATAPTWSKQNMAEQRNAKNI